MKKTRRSGGMNLDELIHTTEWKARERWDRAQLEREEAEAVEELRPLLGDLRRIGIEVRDPFALVPNPSREAIPILIEHLAKPYSFTGRDAIAAALVVPEARPHFDRIVELYRREPNRIVRERLGFAVDATAPADALDTIVSLVADKSLGSARIPLLPYLRRSRDPRARDTLESLVDDPELGKEARAQLTRKRRRSRR